MTGRMWLRRTRLALSALVVEAAALCGALAGMESLYPGIRMAAYALLSFVLLAYALLMLLLLRGKATPIEKDLVAYGTFRARLACGKALDGFARPESKPPKEARPAAT